MAIYITFNYNRMSYSRVKSHGLPCCFILHFALKMEAAWFSETLVIYIITQHHNPEDHDLNLHHCEKN
jgi:hypothetical protein